MKTNAIRGLVAASLLAAGLVAWANTGTAPTAANAAAQVPPALEATLRKNLLERLQGMGKIDEVRRTPIQGLFEIRVGSDIYYSDAEGNHLIQGEMMDTRSKRNLTQDRVDKLLAIDFKDLPLKDAFVMVRGDGKRKMAAFQDPNCGYCKRFERDLQKVDNVTVYMFLYPILGPDSADKSRNIWCARDKARAWTDWMLNDKPAARADGSCDTSALTRNLEFGRQHKITGTPTLVFTDGSRVPGAINAAQLEKLLSGK